MEKMSRYNALAEILKAIAHPTRLLIAEELSQKDRCVSELTAMINADTSTVSKHLALMKNSGVVTSIKKRNQVFYSLRCTCIVEFLGCIESVLALNAREQLALVNTINSNG